MMLNNISPHVFSFLLVKVIMQLIILSLAAMIFNLERRQVRQKSDGFESNNS